MPWAASWYDVGREGAPNMPDDIYRSPLSSFSAPVRNLVSGASDEQLAWMVGPDRKFYSDEAIEAATWELERRRSQPVQAGPPRSFDLAAFLLGPVWYFYHGMVGRGAFITAVLIAAFYGLHPVVAAAGVPPVLWIIFVLIAIGSYCGRYAARDLEESRTQARLYPRYPRRPEASRAAPPAAPDFVMAAQVGSRLVGEQAQALLETEGIASIIKCEDTGVLGPGSGGGTRSVIPARILVPLADAERARDLIGSLISGDVPDPDGGRLEDDQGSSASSS